MKNIYTSGEYLQNTSLSWHAEDSPWKASKIAAMLRKHTLFPTTAAEVGCGAGQIIHELSKLPELSSCNFTGFDLSPQAIELCTRIKSERCKFKCGDLFADTDHRANFDLLLVIDVFEHVPDYLDFVRRCATIAKYKIFHIPLDIHVSAVLRGSLINARENIGHIHYFTAESALATLRDSGLTVVDAAYTCDAIDLFALHPSVKKLTANLPRWVVSRFSQKWSARLFGGYSLLVLTT